MAKLKDLNVGYLAGNWYLAVYEDKVTQSIEENYSLVDLRLTLRADKSTWISFDSRRAWIGGASFVPAYRHDSAEHNLGSYQLKVQHNADGTGSYSVGFGISTSYVLNGSSTVSKTLPTIPRASSVKATGDTIGKDVLVNITKASSSFKHNVKFQFGDKISEKTNVDTTCSFATDLNYAEQIPNSTSGLGMITVETYNGDTLIGTSNASVTLKVPDSEIPTFSEISFVRDDNGVDSSWGVYVQGKSKVTVTISEAKGIRGSTIKSYQITGGGYASNTSSFKTDVLKTSGVIEFTATIVDSRGRSATKKASIIVQENKRPSLSIEAYRCNSTGEKDVNGVNIYIKPTYSPASIAGKNSITSKVFKVMDGSTVKVEDKTLKNGEGRGFGSDQILQSKTYKVVGKVTDALGQSSEEISIDISSCSVPLMVREDLRGLGFGKYNERVNAIDSAWDLYTKGVWNAPAVKKTKAGTQAGIQIILEEV